MSTEDNGNVGLLKPTSSSNEDLSEYTDADESISAPTEFLAEVRRVQKNMNIYLTICTGINTARVVYCTLNLLRVTFYPVRISHFIPKIQHFCLKILLFSISFDFFPKQPMKVKTKIKAHLIKNKEMSLLVCFVFICFMGCLEKKLKQTKKYKHAEFSF